MKQKSFHYWHDRGDCVLYYKSLFPGGKGHEDKVYPERGIDFNPGRGGGKCGAGEDVGVGNGEKILVWIVL